MRINLLIVFILTSSCGGSQNSSVTYLDLSNQKLSRIPDSVFSFSRLESLQLGNRVTIYPPLSALSESDDPEGGLNQIAEVPNDIKALQNLRSLGLCFNNIQTLPNALTKLKKLDTLDLSFNNNLRISEVYQILAQMKSLRYLNILGTRVDTSIVINLRAALPNTKVIATFVDVGVDLEKISKEVK